MPEFDDYRLMPPARVAGTPMQVSAGVSALRQSPAEDAELATQALHGEVVTLFEERGEFGLIQIQRDRYVGWAPMETLSAPVVEATHKIAALRTYAYSRPHLKSAPHFIVSIGARLSITDRENGFVRTARGHWIPEQHVQALSAFEDDPAGVAQRFLHAPYLWGGCESLGLDCTGLTRAAFRACGVTLPRDSDMQAAWAGEAVEGWQEAAHRQRGDMIFWKGHVGIMLDADTLLHANAHHMAVAAEPLSGAIERIAKIYGEPTGARRIDVAKERGRLPDWLAAGRL